MTEHDAVIAVDVSQRYALTVRMDRNLAERFRTVAFRDRRSLSVTAVALIERYVEGKEAEWAATSST
jgi:predicted transcriptional regulator